MDQWSDKLCLHQRASSHAAAQHEADEKIKFLKGFLVRWRHSCNKFCVLFRGLNCELRCDVRTQRRFSIQCMRDG